MRAPFRSRTALLALVTVLATLATSELGARLVFAARVGPRVLLYGTRASRQYLILNAREQDSARPHNAQGEEIRRPAPENSRGAYPKFHPGEIRRDTDQDGNLIYATINSAGFRGAEFSRSKAPDVIRVAALGASSTFGYRDRDDETYPYLLQQILNQTDAEGRSFEVINLGIPHLTSDQIRALFLAEALPLQPDIVTAYIGMNDSHDGFEVVSEARRARGRERPVRRLFERSWGVLRNHAILAAFVDELVGSRGRYSREDLDSFRVGKKERFLENLTAIHEECRRRGIAFIVANQQGASLLLDRDRMMGLTYEEEERMLRDALKANGTLTRRQLDFLVHAELMRSLKDWNLAQGVPLVDVIEATNQHREVLLSWVHLNPDGNRAVAEAFAAEILRQVTPALTTANAGP